VTDTVDMIKRVKFCDNQFKGLEFRYPRFAILHRLSSSPLQQCKHYCATMSTDCRRYLL